MIYITAYFLLSGFLGYIIGRWADNYLNYWIGDPNWAPDHWIYGFILMIAGLFFFTTYTGLYVFSFGLGHFISDLKDFWNLKFYGSDNKEKSERRFWHID
jgi:hypothetical protein